MQGKKKKEKRKKQNIWGKKIKIFFIVLLLSFSFLLKEECTVPAVLIAEQ